MNIIDAFLNSAAVWFMLKALEVAPFAIYDLFVLTKQYFSTRTTQSDSSNEARHERSLDMNRAKLEFVFSGAGFLQFSHSPTSRRLLLIASLLPVLFFVLEIISIFLGSETRVCKTSRDPDIVKAPSLQLFGDGERDFSIFDFQREIFDVKPVIVDSETNIRPCLRIQSIHAGVEYVSTTCTDMRNARAAHAVAFSGFNHHKRIALTVPRLPAAKDFIMFVHSLPSEDSIRNDSLVGIIQINCDVFVNGKTTLRKDAVSKDYIMNEVTAKQIRDDVRILEKETNSTPSTFIEEPGVLWFVWDDLDDFELGARNVVYAIMSQSRKVGLKSASEMSDSNVRILPEIDISCQEEFRVSRTVSIVIIVTGAVLRLFLVALPTPVTSAQYALLQSRKRETCSTFTEAMEEMSSSASA